MPAYFKIALWFAIKSGNGEDMGSKYFAITATILTLLISLSLCGCRQTAEVTPATPTPLENEILLKFLAYLNEESFGVGDEDVVLGLSNINESSHKNILKKYFNEKGYHIDHLVDRFFYLNTDKIIVTVNSSSTEGFHIVQSGHYDKYFQLGGGGMAQWAKDNPGVAIRLTVSMPAYDAKTRYVLLFAGWYLNGLSGAGNLYLMKYEDGNLIEVDYHNMWVS